MLIAEAMPDAMEGGRVNTIEKVLDMRDMEVDVQLALAMTNACT